MAAHSAVKTMQIAEVQHHGGERLRMSMQREDWRRPFAWYAKLKCNKPRRGAVALWSVIYSGGDEAPSRRSELNKSDLDNTKRQLPLGLIARNISKTELSVGGGARLSGFLVRTAVAVFCCLAGFALGERRRLPLSIEHPSVGGGVDAFRLFIAHWGECAATLLT